MNSLPFDKSSTITFAVAPEVCPFTTSPTSNLPNILSSNISLSPIFNCVLAVPMPVAFKTKLLI
jgi:hypothetical protein